MPLYDLEPLPLAGVGLGVMPPVQVPGLGDITHGSNAPSPVPDWGPGLVQSLTADSSVGAWLSTQEVFPSHTDPNFDYPDYIKRNNLIRHVDSFIDVPQNERAFDIRKRTIEKEEETKKSLDAMPWWQALPTRFAGGALDWPTFIPGGALVRSAKGGISITRSMLNVGVAAGIGTTAQELTLHALQQTRTAEESAVNVGASVILGGMLGAGLGAAVSRMEWNRAIAIADRAVNGDPGAINRGLLTSDHTIIDVRSDLFRQLTGAGMAEDRAAQTATIGAVRYGARAARSGDELSALDLYQREREDLLFRRGAEEAAITPEGRVFELQPGEAGARGQIIFEANRAIIDLFKGADESTVIHGLGQKYLDEIASDAARTDMPTGIKDDFNTILNWLGATDYASVTRAQHEQFARGFEAYLREGTAPSSALAQAFESFKQWLMNIYRSVRDLDVEVSDDIRGVFDRMLASDAEIAAARRGEVAGAAPGALGAAAREVPGLEATRIAGRAAGLLVAGTRWLNPLLRLKTNPSPQVRDLAMQMLEDTTYMKGNYAEMTSHRAVETLLTQYNAGLADAVMMGKTAFKEYRQSGGKLSYTDFRDAAGRAMRHLDEDENPAIAKLAKEWRAKVFDPIKDEGIDAGLLKPDVKVSEALSYFSRVWDRNALIKFEPQFKAVVAEFYANALAKEYVKAADAMSARFARLDQELADLRLPPEQRLTALSDVDRKLEQLDGKYSGRGIISKAERLSDLQGTMRKARQAGDDASVARAQEEVKTIKEAGGENLQAYIDERAALRSRRGNLDLNYAGLKEREARVLDSLADLEEDNARGLSRLITRGQVFERELNRLDETKIEAKLTEMRDRFADLLRREDASADRINKLQERFEAEQQKRKETIAAAGEGAGRAAQAPAPDVDASALRLREALEKATKAHAVRMESLNRISVRLDAMDNLDRDGLIDALKDANARMLAVASDRSLAKGERAARLKQRLDTLDPARIDSRVKAIEEMKASAEQRFFETWETKRLGEGVDPRSADPATFRQAGIDIANEVHATFVGKTSDADSARPEWITIKTPGPAKDRTFHIPDSLMDGSQPNTQSFLINDIEAVGRRYVRMMGGDIQLARKMGTPDMEEQLVKVHEDFARLRAHITDPKQLETLDAYEKEAIGDLKHVRDRMRGTPIGGNPDGNFNRMVRNFNHVNYIRTMGEVVLASITDPVRIGMVHGLMPSMGLVGDLVTNLRGIKLSVKEAKLAGNVLEVALGNRLAQITEIIDPHAARGPVESFLANMTEIASRWNGIRIWTDLMKSGATVLTQNRILNAVLAHVDGKISETEHAYLNMLSISPSDRELIAAQYAAHKKDSRGVRVAGTEDWTNPRAIEAFRAGLNKDVDSTIIEASIGDVPNFAHTPTGQALLQFKRHALASHQRILIRGLQENQTRFLGGLVAMTSMGMAITYLKSVSGNREDKIPKFAANPGWWIGEGLDRSGILSIPMEIANTMEKATGYNAIKSPLKAFDEGQQISQKLQNRNLLGALAGPTAGLIGDVGTVAMVPKTLIEGKDVTQGQKNAAESLLPYNSFLGMRQMLRYQVNPRE